MIILPVLPILLSNTYIGFIFLMGFSFMLLYLLFGRFGK